MMQVLALADPGVLFTMKHRGTSCPPSEMPGIVACQTVQQQPIQHRLQDCTTFNIQYVLIWLLQHNIMVFKAATR